MPLSRVIKYFPLGVCRRFAPPPSLAPTVPEINFGATVNVAVAVSVETTVSAAPVAVSVAVDVAVDVALAVDV